MNLFAKMLRVSRIAVATSLTMIFLNSSLLFAQQKERFPSLKNEIDDSALSLAEHVVLVTLVHVAQSLPRSLPENCKELAGIPELGSEFRNIDPFATPSRSSSPAPTSSPAQQIQAESKVSEKLFRCFGELIGTGIITVQDMQEAMVDAGIGFLKDS